MLHIRPRLSPVSVGCVAFSVTERSDLGRRSLWQTVETGSEMPWIEVESLADFPYASRLVPASHLRPNTCLIPIFWEHWLTKREQTALFHLRLVHLQSSVLHHRHLQTARDRPLARHQLKADLFLRLHRPERRHSNRQCRQHLATKRTMR